MADILVKCECGAVLRAPPAAAGRRGKCRKCGGAIAIPIATGAPAPEILDLQAVDETWQLAEVGERTCSVCQTPIEAEAPQIVCDRCGLPFHFDCWQENLGCSAYGCANVNLLKQGPDVRITAASVQSTAAAVSFAEPAAPGADFPWEFVLLAASSLAILLGMLCFGAPSMVLALVSGLVALVRMHSAARKSQLIVIAVSAVLSVGGALFGLIASLAYWG